MDFPWIIPATDDISAQRVTLTLGMGTAYRYFREVAFPGIGGAQFVRHCSWGVAAHALHDEIPALAPSRIAHGIEALACKLVVHSDRDRDDYDGRIRGTRAFEKSPEAWSFRELSQPRYYVHITFRQSVVTALSSDLGLGFAEGGRRFNAMTLTRHGQDLAAAFLNQKVGQGGTPLRKVLIRWMSGSEADGAIRNASIRNAMEPWIGKGQEEGQVMRDRLFADSRSTSIYGTRGRFHLMEAFQELGLDEEPRLSAVLESLRARDRATQALAIAVAVAFEALFAAAQRLVHVAAEVLEKRDIVVCPAETIANGPVQVAGEQLRTRARNYVTAVEQADGKVRHAEADACAQDVEASTSLAELVMSVVRRDGQILERVDHATIRRGSLFSSKKSTADLPDAAEHRTGLSSPRLRQAFRLLVSCHAR